VTFVIGVATLSEMKLLAHVIDNNPALFLEGICHGATVSSSDTHVLLLGSDSESAGTITTSRKVSGSTTRKVSAQISPAPEYVLWADTETLFYDRVDGCDAYGDPFVNPWSAEYKIRPLDILL
jgi:hypothetical protein